MNNINDLVIRFKIDVQKIYDAYLEDDNFIEEWFASEDFANLILSMIEVEYLPVTDKPKVNYDYKPDWLDSCKPERDK